MTHEYVIAYHGSIEPRGDALTTAIGWADEAVLAVGSDEVVRSISRGDSTFIDLDGCVVTAMPTDLDRAGELVRATTDRGLDVGRLLVSAGLLDPTSTLGPGSPADLAIWGPGLDSAGPEGTIAWQLVATVRGGHFTEGDDHRGPFPVPAKP